MKALQMGAFGDICGICNEAITNPICPHCIEEEATQWILDRKPELINSIKGMTALVMGFNYSSTGCVICGGFASVCAHCFVKDLYETLKNEDAVLAEDFAQAFNFELMHQ